MLCTQYRCISCYVKRVKRVCYVHNIDTFNVMSKESKDYVETRDIHIFAHNFLNIQLIFNPKKFWKAETYGFPTISSNAIYVKAC